MRLLVRVLALVASCTAVAAVAAGCGDDSSTSSGSSGSSGTISLASFREKAEPLCKDASEAMAKTAPPSSFPAKLDDFDQGSKAMLDAIKEPFTKLTKLDAPKDHEATFEDFSTALTDAIDNVKEVRRLVAAKNDDTDALGLPTTNVKTNVGEANNAASKLGLDACSSMAFKSAY